MPSVEDSSSHGTNRLTPVDEDVAISMIPAPSSALGLYRTIAPVLATSSINPGARVHTRTRARSTRRMGRRSRRRTPRWVMPSSASSSTPSISSGRASATWNLIRRPVLGRTDRGADVSMCRRHIPTPNGSSIPTQERRAPMSSMEVKKWSASVAVACQTISTLNARFGAGTF
ncbi:Uncharacterised protein [Chlamydia trachomatis]|nr:Uncharacterised protein [Chlamydia trachomatis]